ncbi:ABC transporter ATP-binding protein [Gordonia sp. DT219]|uniref:ABC transporter ATP-binding protein n=1 Tax=Gordonia sp. DT219 TaxID=3416658 RepID=UPI003CEF0059
MELSSPFMQAQGVSVEFSGHEVVHGADFTLRGGEVTALVGPNGSGKSTLLRALSRLVRRSSGAITLGDDTDASALSAREFARRVTLLSQQRPTPVGITVRDIVEFGRHPYRSGWRGRDEDGAAAIARAIAATGLAHMTDMPLETLSGGQLQRAWFASALAQQTEVLLLDEPTNHLDLRYQIEVLELIRSLADDHGAAVGVVLHDLNHAADIADQIVVLDSGRVVAEGTPEQALAPDLLTQVWGLPISVTEDPTTGLLEVRARRARTTRVGSRQPVMAAPGH